jgi:hypothetical protein
MAHSLDDEKGQCCVGKNGDEIGRPDTAERKRNCEENRVSA